MAGGRSSYAVNCSQCHGLGAAGFPGYPNLNDDAWLWGGSLEAIQKTIRYGVRSDHPDTRDSVMPAFLKDELLTPAQINDVTEYVLALSGQKSDDGAARRGKIIYAEQCASCHRPTGKGNAEFGAPDLTDAIWLFGGDKKTISDIVAYSRRGVMPAWEARLDPVTIKQIAIYVHALGGGK
jgi:cytochrome c oxidase cbb3-type subunit 3